MKNKVKLIVLSGLMAFPMMLAFQNCSRTTAMQITDQVNSKAQIDTDTLPPGETQINQPNAVDNSSNGASGSPSNDQPAVDQPRLDQPAVDIPAPGSGVNGVEPNDSSSSGDSVSSGGSDSDDGQVNTQVEDHAKELKDDVDAGPAECDNDAHESQNDANGVLSEDGNSITHIRGNKVLSPADFNGATEIDEISDAYGKLTICGLQVKSLVNTGGRIILVGSLVDDLSQHKGDIGVNQSRAIISGSSGKVHKAGSSKKDGKQKAAAVAPGSPEPGSQHKEISGR